MGKITSGGGSGGVGGEEKERKKKSRALLTSHSLSPIWNTRIKPQSLSDFVLLLVLFFSLCAAAADVNSCQTFPNRMVVHGYRIFIIVQKQWMQCSKSMYLKCHIKAF